MKVEATRRYETDTGGREACLVIIEYATWRVCDFNIPWSVHASRNTRLCNARREGDDNVNRTGEENIVSCEAARVMHFRKCRKHVRTVWRMAKSECG